MKAEVNRWIKMARDDLDSARSNYKNKKYYVCAFLSQQTVEKALKAVIIKKTNQLIKIHDLVILGRKAGLNYDLIKKSEQLSSVYIETRYGVVGSRVPSQKFNRKNSEEFLKIAEEILKWAGKSI